MQNKINMRDQIEEITKSLGSIAKRVRNLETQKRASSHTEFPGEIIKEKIEDAKPGDIITIPCSTIYISGLTIPPGVTVLGTDSSCVFIYPTNPIILSPEVTLKSVTIIKLCDSPDDCIALIGPITGHARLQLSIIKAFNCGSGDAIALYHKYGTSGEVTISSSDLVGESIGGNGYGVKHG